MSDLRLRLLGPFDDAALAAATEGLPRCGFRPHAVRFRGTEHVAMTVIALPDGVPDIDALRALAASLGASVQAA